MDKRRKRILIVDDSELVRTMLSETLNEAGYDVVEAINGKDALDKISDKPADMIISDLNMPEMNGVELIRKIRSRKENRFIPIIMLTVEDAIKIREEGKAAGVSGWLVKPFKPESVLSIVKLIS